jgi:MFS family permease
LGLGFAHAAWHGWALFLVYGLYFGLTEGVEKAFVADWVPSELRGTAYGVYHFIVGVGMLPASVMFGWLYKVGGASIAFTFGAILAAVAGLFLLALRPPRPLTQETA